MPRNPLCSRLLKSLSRPFRSVPGNSPVQSSKSGQCTNSVNIRSVPIPLHPCCVKMAIFWYRKVILTTAWESSACSYGEVVQFVNVLGNLANVGGRNSISVKHYDTMLIIKIIRISVGVVSHWCRNSVGLMPNSFGLAWINLKSCGLCCTDAH